MLSNQEIKDYIFDKLQVTKPYICRAPYTVKGVALYLIFFNSRLPGSTLSASSIMSQNVFKSFSIQNDDFHETRFEDPVPLDDFSHTIKPNSIFNFIDLAGDFLTKEYSL